MQLNFYQLQQELSTLKKKTRNTTSCPRTMIFMLLFICHLVFGRKPVLFVGLQQGCSGVVLARPRFPAGRAPSKRWVSLRGPPWHCNWGFGYMANHGVSDACDKFTHGCGEMLGDTRKRERERESEREFSSQGQPFLPASLPHRFFFYLFICGIHKVENDTKEASRLPAHLDTIFIF